MQATARHKKRRLLDARRGKCRVRLGCQLDDWCALKKHLGFPLHSQLAKFLLDRYRSTTSPCSDPTAVSFFSVSLESLQSLLLSGHQHGRECALPPIFTFNPPFGKTGLLWHCGADHKFQWDLSQHLSKESNQTDSCTSLNQYIDIERQPKCNKEFTKTEGNKPYKESKKVISEIAYPENAHCRFSNIDNNHWSQKYGKKSVSFNNVTDVTAENIGNERQHKATANEENLEKEGRMLFHPGVNKTLNQAGKSDIITLRLENADQLIDKHIETKEWTGTVPCNDKKQATASNCSSNQRYKDYCEGMSQTENNHSVNNQVQIKPLEAMSVSCHHSPNEILKKTEEKKDKTVGYEIHSGEQEVESLTIEKPSNLDSSTDICDMMQDSMESEEKEDTFSEMDVMMDYIKNRQQDLQEKVNSSGKKEQSKALARQKSHVDEELAQICKKRIRKATPNELLLCELDNCGKIFSKRQYLNYHQKYQHMNQRTFCCSVQECGKTFNFKKHLKEHEKRHSDRRDFICEFCARAFRSSSNLIIHRRIHTGEKPLQCEFCGFTCRQKASLNWHMKKHDADVFYQFPCDICGQRFEKPDNLAAHRSRKHPASLEIKHSESSCKENASENPSCCKNGTPDSLPRTAIDRAGNVSPNVKEPNFPDFSKLTTNKEPQESSQTSQHGQSEISLVIIL
ncbi:hypothetical protein GDO86_012997 [Hymenochirus boettgeri]|uniref:E3 ubiquitin-protein ligase ZFP91 n=1 Tax=Hymenochirus boettgeri TaxID=247094 RepID=A0A8T2IUZ1_9PIPI|nr:hypothetical protein GDO86_012997 [Hymenochirus boettgeri]